MRNDMKKIMTISDSPLGTSGVGRQTRMFIEALLDSGKYEVISLSCAKQIADPRPFMTEKYKELWKLFPCEGFSNLEIIRSLHKSEKPDLIWIMTDPRFYESFWSMDTEIRSDTPVVYYHVWDNYPYPKFNKKYYYSNDVIVSASKLTEDVVSRVAPDVKNYYLPHTVDTEVYKKLPEGIYRDFMSNNFSFEDQKRIFFWNNRNCGRKNPGNLLWWYKEFLDRVGHDKAVLILHTDPKEPQGLDLVSNLEHLGLTNGQVFLSNKKVTDDVLCSFYNMADCTINISDAEGFGLSTLESMACETPVIATMTGGLRDQLFDGEEWYGIGIEPATKTIVGSQRVPYIYEDRISKEDFIKACTKILNMPRADLKKWGKSCRRNVISNFGIRSFGKSWVEIVDSTISDLGSWTSRRGYKKWEMKIL